MSPGRDSHNRTSAAVGRREWKAAVDRPPDAERPGPHGPAAHQIASDDDTMSVLPPSLPVEYITVRSTLPKTSKRRPNFRAAYQRGRRRDHHGEPGGRADQVLDLDRLADLIVRKLREAA